MVVIGASVDASALAALLPGAARIEAPATVLVVGVEVATVGVAAARPPLRTAAGPHVAVALAPAIDLVAVLAGGVGAVSITIAGLGVRGGGHALSGEPAAGGEPEKAGEESSAVGGSGESASEAVEPGTVHGDPPCCDASLQKEPQQRERMMKSRSMRHCA
jgi:hypothetical protein